MTIEELIKRLQEFPQDATVKLWDDGEDAFTDQMIVRIGPGSVYITIC